MRVSPLTQFFPLFLPFSAFIELHLIIVLHSSPTLAWWKQRASRSLSFLQPSWFGGLTGWVNFEINQVLFLCFFHRVLLARRPDWPSVFWSLKCDNIIHVFWAASTEMNVKLPAIDWMLNECTLVFLHKWMSQNNGDSTRNINGVLKYKNNNVTYLDSDTQCNFLFINQ